MLSCFRNRHTVIFLLSYLTIQRDMSNSLKIYQLYPFTPAEEGLDLQILILGLQSLLTDYPKICGRCPN
jgi:hypothetical protein